MRRPFGSRPGAGQRAPGALPTTVRVLAAILPPILAAVFQWLLWPWISPYAWVLFFPAVLISAHLGGFWSGLASTGLGAVLVWYFFIPPPLNWVAEGTSGLVSTATFLIVGYLASTVYERLRCAQQSSEASLQEREALLQLFIRYAPASLAMFDSEMRYLAASRRWVDDYLLGDTDIAGRCHYEIFPNIPERWREAHRRGLAGELIQVDEDFFEKRDGTLQWLHWEIRPWHTADGAIGGIVIFAEDITRYKQALEEIHRLNADLERRVEERTTELLAANRELDTFAYAVSHDLRAPLRTMSGLSQILEEGYAGQLGGDGSRYLRQIRQASRKMGDLIDGILALSRISREKMRHDEIDLSAMAEGLLADMAAREPERRVAWQVEPGLAAWGDARLIEALMTNLLGNAWKYTSKTPEALIRVHRQGACFCVSDNGAGFDPAHAAQLFQPFQRLHRQEDFPGMGIGLATVQRIVHRHGGRISASAAPGRGATFCFSLDDAPAAQPEP